MTRLWPWSSGAPVEEEHSEFEETLGPDVAEESECYDLRPRNHQATAGHQAHGQAGADSQRQPNSQAS